LIPAGTIRNIAERSAERLLKYGAVRGDRSAIVHAVEKALTDELEVEKRLREEADKILELHMKEAKSAKADLGALRERILQKLASDRGVVLK
jgi:hypothetical protein